MKTVKRPIRIEGPVAYIPLTKGYEAVIDAEDVPLVEGRCWSAAERYRSDGSLRVVYAQAKINGILTALHRHITKADVEFEVDHKDGDGLNNRRRGETGNLRPATRSQNQHNRRLSHDNTSGIEGVSWFEAKGKWRASIGLNGKWRYLGLFKCRTAAAVAYMKASRMYHGDFGRTAYGQGRQGTGGTGSVQDSVGGSPIQPPGHL